jgi:hypothetical protein
VGGTSIFLAFTENASIQYLELTKNKISDKSSDAIKDAVSVLSIVEFDAHFLIRQIKH